MGHFDSFRLQWIGRDLARVRVDIRQIWLYTGNTWLTGGVLTITRRQLMLTRHQDWELAEWRSFEMPMFLLTIDSKDSRRECGHVELVSRRSPTDTTVHDEGKRPALPSELDNLNPITCAQIIDGSFNRRRAHARKRSQRRMARDNSCRTIHLRAQVVHQRCSSWACNRQPAPRLMSRPFCLHPGMPLNGELGVVHYWLHIVHPYFKTERFSVTYDR